MTKGTLFKAFAAIAALVFAGIIISVSFFAKPVIEKILRQAGFEGATVESVSIGLSGTNLKNISLDESHIGGIEAYATFADIAARRLGKIIVTDAVLRWPLLPAGDGTPPASALNTYSQEIELRNAQLILPSPLGDIPLTINGLLVDRGADYQFSGAVDTQNDALTANGQILLTVDKATRHVDARIDIAEASAKINTTEASAKVEPAVDIRRINGWVEASIDAGAAYPAINAQITAGATRLYGVPLQGMTITATPQQFILSGTVTNNGGDISADIRMDDSDAALDKLIVAVSAQLKNLDTLGLEKLKGQGSLTLSLQAEKDKAGAWQDPQQWKNFSGTADVRAQNLTLPGLVDKAIASAKTTFALDPATRVISLQSKDAAYSDARVSVKGAAADLTLHLSAKPVVEGRLNIAEIAQKASPAYLVPVRLALSFHSLSSLQGGTGFSGEITEKNGLLYAKISGKHDSGTGNGDVSVSMPPLTLIKGVSQLKDIFPASTEYVQDGFGTIGLDARLAWTKKNEKTTLNSSGKLFLKNFTGTVQENEISDVNTVLTLESLMPLAFTHQTVSVGALNVGLPLSNGVVEASLDRKNVFSLHRAAWELAKGRISSSAFAFPLDDMTADVTLTATKLDLPELFKIAPMEGLDATGTVNGTLPLEIREGAAQLNNGVLETEGPGFIRYNPQEPPAFLKDSSNKQIADLRVALQAFEYESLRMILSGEVGKNQKITLQIKGKNKDFYDGRAVALNLNVEGPLQNVLKYKPGGQQIPDTIKKQLEDYEKNHAKQ